MRSLLCILGLHDVRIAEDLWEPSFDAPTVTHYRTVYRCKRGCGYEKVSEAYFCPEHGWPMPCRTCE